MNIAPEFFIDELIQEDDAYLESLCPTHAPSKVREKLQEMAAQGYDRLRADGEFLKPESEE